MVHCRKPSKPRWHGPIRRRTSEEDNAHRTLKTKTVLEVSRIVLNKSTFCVIELGILIWMGVGVYLFGYYLRFIISPTEKLGRACQGLFTVLQGR